MSRFRAEPIPQGTLLFVKACVWLEKGEMVQNQEAAGTPEGSGSRLWQLCFLQNSPLLPTGQKCGYLSLTALWFLARALWTVPPAAGAPAQPWLSLTPAMSLAACADPGAVTLQFPTLRRNGRVSRM